jgi:hypothetical protein
MGKKLWKLKKRDSISIAEEQWLKLGNHTEQRVEHDKFLARRKNCHNHNPTVVCSLKS